MSKPKKAEIEALLENIFGKVMLVLLLTVFSSAWLTNNALPIVVGIIATIILCGLFKGIGEDLEDEGDRGSSTSNRADRRLRSHRR